MPMFSLISGAVRLVTARKDEGNAPQPLTPTRHGRRAGNLLLLSILVASFAVASFFVKVIHIHYHAPHAPQMVGVQRTVKLRTAAFPEMTNGGSVCPECDKATASSNLDAILQRVSSGPDGLELGQLSSASDNLSPDRPAGSSQSPQTLAAGVASAGPAPGVQPDATRPIPSFASGSSAPGPDPGAQRPLQLQTASLPRALSAWETMLLPNAASSPPPVQPLARWQPRNAVALRAGTFRRGRAPRRDVDGIHVICTSDGSAALNWQTVVMYHSFLQVAPASDMHCFTRILHRSTPDELMLRVPTLRVDPLDPACDAGASQACPYPVAGRPKAVADWVASGDLCSRWILMVETDYVFVRPIHLASVMQSARHALGAKPEHGSDDNSSQPGANSSASGPSSVATQPYAGAPPLPEIQAVGYPWKNIKPSHGKTGRLMRRYFPESKGPLTLVPGTGNAPVLIQAPALRRLLPHWVNVTAAMETDPDVVSSLGWVREMYAYSVASALARVPHVLPHYPHSLIAMPTVHKRMGHAHMIHFTGRVVLEDGAHNKVWSFNKAFWPGAAPEHIPEPPAELSFPTIRLLVDTINTALREYAASKGG
eukprot:jgi/Mesvir1/23572/Mv18268-RA.1